MNQKSSICMAAGQGKSDSYCPVALYNLLSNPWKEVQQQSWFPFCRQGRLREVK